MTYSAKTASATNATVLKPSSGVPHTNNDDKIGVLLKFSDEFNRCRTLVSKQGFNIDIWTEQRSCRNERNSGDHGWPTRIVGIPSETPGVSGGSSLRSPALVRRTEINLSETI